jgi:hypothetical protein
MLLVVVVVVDVVTGDVDVKIPLATVDINIVLDPADMRIWVSDVTSELTSTQRCRSSEGLP